MLDRLRVHPLTDEEASARVPQVVDPRRGGEPGDLERRPPYASTEVRDTQWPASWSGEQQSIGRGTRCLEVPAELLDQEAGDLSLAHAVRLGPAEDRPAVHV